MKQSKIRVKGVSRESDYPGAADEKTRKDLKEFFEYIGSRWPDPHGKEPETAGAHSAIGAMALNPGLALILLKALQYVNDPTSWGGQRVDLRELAVQVVNLYFKCDLTFQAHLPVARKFGISLEQQAALPYWRTAAYVFNEEQLLVIEYTNAVCVGDVSDELFSRVLRRYGAKGAMECTAVAAIYSLWAMIVNATGAHFDFGFGTPGA